MRLENYIKKDKEILDKLKTDCKPFLKELNKGGFLYRGTNKNFKDIEKMVPRTDRLPLGTDMDVHIFLDKLFKKKFGWKVRSEGVFVNPNVYETTQYGRPYFFFPIGKYKYVWSPDVNDLTIYIEDEMEDAWAEYHDEYGYEDEWDEEPEEDEPDEEKMMKRTVDSYISKGLINNKRNEMAFKCKSYYLVNINYEKLLEKEL